MLLPLAGVVALAGCRPQGSDAGHYIKLSDVVLTFAAEDEEVKSVTVRSNPDWSFTGDASWVEVSREGNTLEISVKPNADAERSAKIGLTAGEATAEIEVRQLANEGPDARYRLLDKLANAAMSPSGRYVGGFYRDVLGENEWQYTAVIIDLDTDEWLEFGPYPETLLGLSETEVMTDQGVLYISDTTNGGCVAFDLEGNYFVPGSAPGYGSLVLQGVSADGSVMVGYTEGAPGGVMYGAVKVVDGEVRPLELPDTNFRGEEWWAGVLVRGISADGSVMYGTSWENYDYGMVYWDKEGNVDWVGSDLRTMTTVQRPDHLTGDTYPYNIVNGMMCGANQMQISPDGKWIAGNFRKERYDGESDEVLSTSRFLQYRNQEDRAVRGVRRLHGHGRDGRRARPGGCYGHGSDRRFLCRPRNADQGGRHASVDTGPVRHRSYPGGDPLRGPRRPEGVGHYAAGGAVRRRDRIVLVCGSGALIPETSGFVG